MFKLFKYVKAVDWMFLGLLCCFLGIQVYASITTPDKIMDLINAVTYQTSITKPCIYLVLYTFMAIGGMIGVGVTTGFFVADYSAIIRSITFNKINHMSLKGINKFSIPSLLTRTTNDTKQIETTLTTFLTMALSAPATIVGGTIKIGTGINWKDEWQMAILILVTTIVMSAVLILVMLFTYPKFMKLRVMTDDMNDISRENISGVRVIRAYTAEKYQADKFSNANESLTKLNIVTRGIFNGIIPIIFFFVDALNIGVYFVGAYLMKKGSSMNMAEIVKMSTLASLIVTNFLFAAMSFVTLPQGNVSAKRIIEVLNEKIDIVSPTNPITEFKTKGEVTFENVSFKIGNSKENILSKINFSVKSGQTVALVGKNGAGKSTIANLIPRFYDPSSGKVLVDGVDIKDMDLKTLRKKIGYINQKSVLFSGTVKYNVMFGLEDKEWKNDARLSMSVSQSDTFIRKMDKKENSEVTQGGNNFSGGQKQRLSIARALATNPEILIFDDSFSALDFKTDRILREELNSKFKKTTKIIIAQRIGTIMNSDEIIFLEHGKIIARGTHKQLFKKCKLYRDLTLTQMSEKEALHG